MKKLSLLISLLFPIVALNCESSDVPLDQVRDFTTVTRITPNGIQSGDLFAGSIATTDEFTIVSAHGDDQRGEKTGAIYIFQRNGQNFVGSAFTLRLDEPTGEDRLGYSVGISGDLFIVGAPYNDKYGQDAGIAFVYQHTGNNLWTLVKELSSPTPNEGDQFGRAVDIEGGIVVVGSWQDQENYYDTEFIPKGAGVGQGSVYVFEVATDWGFTQRLVPGDDQGHRWDGFSRSLVLEGSQLVVGAPGTDNTSYKDPGSVYVFQNSSGAWNQVARLEAEDGQEQDFFGAVFDLDGEHLAIAAPGNFNPLLSGLLDLAGTAYIFEGNGNSWTQVKKLEAAEAIPDDDFGQGIAINKDYVVVGAPGTRVHVRENGAAYFFDRHNNWAESHRIEAPDPLSEDFFGASMDMADDMLFVGAPSRCNETGCFAGALYFVH